MAVTRVVLCLLSLIPGILSLRVTAGSPCTSVCPNPTNTTTDEIVCIDSQYTSTTIGSQFQSCVACELQSVYGDQSTGETDVNWGLYNLRYAFSACVYDYPASVTNVSTPCLVSCTPLSPALEFQLINPTPATMGSFCGDSAFADNVVTTCEQCYGLTSQQAFLANFLEAVRYNCHFQTLIGNAFPISPSRIFNSTELPTTTVALTTSATAGASSGVQKNLTIIIVFPIIGFLFLAFFTALCCFCLVRHRRKKAKKRSYAHHLHARWNDTTISTPGQAAWGNFSPYHSPGAGPYQMMGSPGYGPGFSMVDSDGRRYDTGFYSYTSPVSPVSVPAQAFQPEKPTVQEQTYFPPPPSQQDR
ncbi:hypothetical protein VTN77DRAFT_4557 [Rasamsonia byssochlamydoides]|uniref:uncharacterized protein n=1 Tax=Rasamsonia byssochlamydoides TaxID=89139 RepID=UPI0037447613